MDTKKAKVQKRTPYMNYQSYNFRKGFGLKSSFYFLQKVFCFYKTAFLYLMASFIWQYFKQYFQNPQETCHKKLSKKVEESQQMDVHILLYTAPAKKDCILD